MNGATAAAKVGAAAAGNPLAVVSALAVALLGLATVAYLWRQARLNARARREILKEVERESRQRQPAASPAAVRRRSSGAANSADATRSTAAAAALTTRRTDSPRPTAATTALNTRDVEFVRLSAATLGPTPVGVVQEKPRKADRSLSLPLAPERAASENGSSLPTGGSGRATEPGANPAANPPATAAPPPTTAVPPVPVTAAPATAPARSRPAIPDAAAGVEPRPTVRFADPAATPAAATARSSAPGPARPALSKPALSNGAAPSPGPAKAVSPSSARAPALSHVVADVVAALDFLEVRELRQIAEAAVARLEVTDAWETVEKGGALDTSRASLQMVQDLRGEVSLFRTNSEQLRAQRDRLEKELKSKEAAWHDRAAKAEAAAKAAEEHMARLKKKFDGAPAAPHAVSAVPVAAAAATSVPDASARAPGPAASAEV